MEGLQDPTTLPERRLAYPFYGLLEPLSGHPLIVTRANTHCGVLFQSLELAELVIEQFVTLNFPRCRIDCIRDQTAFLQVIRELQVAGASHMLIDSTLNSITGMTIELKQAIRAAKDGP